MIGWIRRVHIAPEKSEAGRTIIGPCDPTFALTTWLDRRGLRSEEHTSELQSLMRISYAVFCLKKINRLVVCTVISINMNRPLLQYQHNYACTMQSNYEHNKQVK